MSKTKKGVRAAGRGARSWCGKGKYALAGGGARGVPHPWSFSPGEPRGESGSRGGWIAPAAKGLPPNRGPPPLSSRSRRGHIPTDRDRVDDVPGLKSTSCAAILPVPKNRDPVPAPAAIAPPRIRGSAGRLRSASGRRDRSHPVLRSCDSPNAVRAGSDAPRRPVADRMGAAGSTLPLVDRLLSARGRHRGFFGGHDRGETARIPRGHRST